MAGKYERGASEYEERVVALNRVSKTVKGGRVMKFAALVVIGDQKGTIGVGQGKAAEVPDAIRKAIEDAKKNLVTISLKGSSIPHETIGEFGAGRVLLKPAAPGTGVIAGGAARAVLELAGVKDVFAKSLGTDNVLNIVKAVAEGLKELQSPEAVSARRGVSVAKIYGWKEN